ncbi:hypothetical protein [Listeria booriae]|uniref:Uncharacterized protein n=1 Tax=Listeria booriae TaxID=1552123 RepID=A0A7X1DSB7_9LIST|nr:hypothetical protein [Listeria booriae]MBC1228793.1 hypothetical protein [Listeria booriae]MBC1318432.1 hypothetical protein [Listeria booriae]MBC1333449.1 hypothetical protein [Listeria booriae]MBC2373616.1 hypothetical protein [Listeria booriae]MBC2388755.1 hypothetical protein [Listeria booriae]
MADKLIRNIPDATIQELKEMADKSNYKSLNEFLVSVLTSVAMGNYFEEKEQKYQQLISYVTETLENNTEVLRSIIK